jgi:hypothetical protein
MASDDTNAAVVPPTAARVASVTITFFKIPPLSATVSLLYHFHNDLASKRKKV